MKALSVLLACLALTACGKGEVVSYHTTTHPVRDTDGEAKVMRCITVAGKETCTPATN